MNYFLTEEQKMIKDLARRVAEEKIVPVRAKYDEEGLTFGAGINVHTGDFRVKINYAYLDFGTFDYVHLYTLNIGMD